MAGAGILVAMTFGIFACTSGGGTPLPTLPSIALPSSLPSGLPQAFVQFQSQGGSTIAGGAALLETGGKTSIVLALSGVDVATPLSGTVFAGTCDSVPTPGASAAGASASASGGASAGSSAEASVAMPTQFDLGPITGASSTTTVDVPISELTSTPHSIAIFSAGGAASASTSTESAAPSAGASAGASLGASESAAASVAPSLAPSLAPSGGGMTVVACGEITTVAPSGLPSAAASESLPATSPAGSGLESPAGSTSGSAAPSPSGSY
jgi:hypothetical protein